MLQGIYLHVPTYMWSACQAGQLSLSILYLSLCCLEVTSVCSLSAECECCNFVEVILK
jgi:hypothetical protein